jgi:hypothetical protein
VTTSRRKDHRAPDFLQARIPKCQEWHPKAQYPTAISKVEHGSGFGGRLQTLVHDRHLIHLSPTINPRRRRRRNRARHSLKPLPLRLHRLFQHWLTTFTRSPGFEVFTTAWIRSRKTRSRTSRSSANEAITLPGSSKRAMRCAFRAATTAIVDRSDRLAVVRAGAREVARVPHHPTVARCPCRGVRGAIRSVRGTCYCSTELGSSADG